MSATAYFIMTVDRDTCRVIGVGVYSSSNITCMGREFHVTPGAHWKAEGDCYGDAADKMREYLSASAPWFGSKGSPMYEAIMDCAENGGPSAIEWPEETS